MRGLLAEIGFAGASLARELDDGSLMLIDGHLRADVAADAEIPVLVLDVDAEEADKILATFDSVGAMAETDEAKLGDLVAELGFESDALNAMLADMVPEIAVTEGATTKTQVSFEAGDGEPTPEGAPTYKEQYAVMIECVDEGNQMLVYEWCIAQGYKCKVVTT